MFGAVGGALLATFAWVLPGIATGVEDEVFEKQLAAWTERAELLPVEGAKQRELGPGVWLYTGRAALEPVLSGWLADLPLGVHEFNDLPLEGLQARELFVAVLDGEPRRWLLYDVGPFEAFEAPWSLRFWVTIVGGSLAALAGLLVGSWLLWRIWRAIDELGELAAASPDDLVPPPLAAESRPDEVGQLARRWRAGLVRISGALERERRFARDASHELRTPLTAARGAVELLGTAPDEVYAAELRERALDALVQADRKVAMFLWLAREERPLEAEAWGLDEWLESTLPEEVRLTVLGEPPPMQVAEGAMRVLVDSLLANARQQGAGDVRVQLDGRRLLVSNRLAATPGGAKPVESAFEPTGLGLRLVRDLSTRLGFELQTRRSSQRFEAELLLIE